MAINKAMLLALKALSYPEPDITKTYKLHRAVVDVKAPFGRFYRLWDKTIDCCGHQVPVRIYEPKERRSEELLLFFHGGGWVTESIDTYHNVCKNLARHTGRRVISADYRLAPEHPFPAGLEDCYAVTKALCIHAEDFGISPQEIILVGDSAGGNLAAAVSLLGRDRGDFEISRQILLYPAVGGDYSDDAPYPSLRENGTGYLLTTRRIREYMSLYVSKPEDLESPYLAPMLMEDLTHQPDTLMMTAEYDPLRDEGEAYAARLHESGNQVVLHRMKDALHGFFSLDPHFAHVKRAYEWINEFLGGDAVCQTPDK